MSFFQRFKSILAGILMLFFVALLLLLPNEAYYLVAGVLGLMLIIYGIRLLWYYLTMARHMVGGKTILYQSVIVIDLGLFSSTLMSVSSAIMREERLCVPLKTMCSMKWLRPFSASVSAMEPTWHQMPRETERR